MLRLEFDSDTARVIFDQPGSRANTLSTAMWTALGEAIAAVRQRTELRGLVLASAKDGIFLAGADLNELYSLPVSDREPIERLLRQGLAVLDDLENLPVPTIAAIDGACLGGGLEVALACDYRVAGTHAKVKLGLPEVKLALIPGWGGTQRLPRVVGLARGAEMLALGDVLTAEAAKQIGLVDAIIASERLVGDATAIVQTAKRADWLDRRKLKHSACEGETLRQAPGGAMDDRMAIEAVLRVVAAGAPLPLSEALPIETKAFAPLLAAPSARTKIAAFLKK